MAPITWQPGATLAEILTSHGALFEKRDSTPSYMDNPEILAIMSISLSMASISVLAALCAFYWFVRMRRSFRHDLIMLLIQSDMMKALWLVICPLAFFAKVPIDSNSTFCQVSGFLLTVSIEASDIAVLLIAVHTALFILRPRGSSGAAGLYPYRRIAYTCWAIIPLVLAAVVPITGGQFADNGPHCYLPLRPAWYLSALSWIPRYVISAFIIVVYTVLYLYVACRFRSFTRDQRRASTAHSDHPEQHRKHHNHRHDHSGDVPPTPPIVDYGFLDSARDSLAKDGDPRDRQHSVDSTISTLDFGGGGGGGASTPLPRRPDQAMRNSIRWNTVNFANDGSAELQQQSRRGSQSGLVSPASPSLQAEESIPIRAPESVVHSPRSSQQSSHVPFTWRRSTSSGTPSHSRSHSHTHSLTNSIHSVSNMICALRRGPPRTRSSTQTSTTTSSSSVFLPQNETEDAMRRSRDKQQRQLRLLFVYPAIYMVTWIAPFVSHVLQYDDDYANLGASHGTGHVALQIVSVTSLCIGAAVDCCFFTAWERPWLHLRGGFWENLALRLRIRRPGGRSRHGAGRTREERFVDARTARVRREQEENLENLTIEAAAAARRASGHRSQLGAPPREWWDALDAGSSEHLNAAGRYPRVSGDGI
ncbi:G protein-coupled glucose receptor regulating Gpa2-domain-containing protein [Annulohypoxylon truncatum]|uniref:G protein-coupled glucose receptor regulating Gpa2-domain-containing protein n=1 Tax=Annulohypoxylon truncatum TaxID=327061 RepID=UPI0020077985|nr:G protein-coupled glucose receptor regulating Gpa2-domain-containing protein [Annulohypoxylon truncatum]KAI1211115.1 G protein-coupled glucose receptor regulating Gpa2-domain-containing protein [Annulohypoxylon truncatum]